MSALPEYARWTVRPPWPDEFERLPGQIQEALRRAGVRRHWIWVLVAGEIERIVGTITLAERDPSGPTGTPDGRIDYTIARAWRFETEPIQALLEAALAQAEALDLTPIEAQTDTDTPATVSLIARGFAVTRRTEVWRVPLVENFVRRHAAVERALARHPVNVHPLDEKAITAVRRICAAHGLLAGHRVFLSDAPGEGLDTELSFIAGSAEAPEAILLTRRLGGAPYVEVLARNPDRPGRGPEVGALLHAFFSTAQKLGARDALCVIDPDHNPDSLRLIARNRAECIERISVLRRPAAR